MKDGSNGTSGIKSRGRLRRVPDRGRGCGGLKRKTQRQAGKRPRGKEAKRLGYGIARVAEEAKRQSGGGGDAVQAAQYRRRLTHQYATFWVSGSRLPWHSPPAADPCSAALERGRELSPNVHDN
jgi:hypothetical protein